LISKVSTRGKMKFEKIGLFLNQKRHLILHLTKLRNLSNILGAKSLTVLWSGNGYHIYQPLEAFPLKQEELFASKSTESSKEFLQFAEQHLTNYKSDISLIIHLSGHAW
jgi:hypothetical protein